MNGTNRYDWFSVVAADPRGMSTGFAIFPDILNLKMKQYNNQ